MVVSLADYEFQWVHSFGTAALLPGIQSQPLWIPEEDNKTGFYCELRKKNKKFAKWLYCNGTVVSAQTKHCSGMKSRSRSVVVDGGGQGAWWWMCVWSFISLKAFKVTPPEKDRYVALLAKAVATKITRKHWHSTTRILLWITSCNSDMQFTNICPFTIWIHMYR